MREKPARLAALSRTSDSLAVGRHDLGMGAPVAGLLGDAAGHRAIDRGVARTSSLRLYRAGDDVGSSALRRSSTAGSRDRQIIQQSDVRRTPLGNGHGVRRRAFGAGNFCLGRRFGPGARSPVHRIAPGAIVGTTAAITFITMCVGAYVSSSGAGLACLDIPGCAGNVIVYGSGQFVQMLHRGLAGATLLLAAGSLAIVWAVPSSKQTRAARLHRSRAGSRASIARLVKCRTSLAYRFA